MRFLLSLMLRQENRVYAGENGEALHKMRVSTRRLRSALQVFKKGFEPEELRPYVKRLRELGRDLGVLRDLDVIIADLQQYSESRGAEEQRALTHTIDFFSARRLKGLIVTREYLRSQRYIRFIRRFHDFVEDDDAPESESAVRVSYEGPTQIYERIADVRSLGRNLDRATIGQLHDLRICFKRLRYTIEMYQDVIGEAVVAILDTLKAIQEHLGALQDSQRATEMIDDFVREVMPEDGDVRTAVETYRRYRSDQQQPLIEAFGELWESFDNPQTRANIALAVARF
jgi:CHAD domain-containing protein